MRPRRLNIHLSGSFNSVFLTSIQQSQAFHGRLHDVLRETLHENALKFVLSDLQRVFGLRVLEQVVQFLVVNLQERTVDGHFQALLGDLVEKVPDTTRNYTSLLLLRLGSHTELAAGISGHVNSLIIEHGHLLIARIQRHPHAFLPRVAPEHSISLARPSLSIREYS